MGSTWRRRRRGQTHGAGVQQRPNETVSRGCAEAHRLKNPGAEELLAIGGPGAARIGALGGLRPGRRRVGVARLGARIRPALAGGGGARRPGDEPELGGLQRPCRLQRPGSAQGPGAHRRPWTSSPASAVLFSREERAGPSLARPGSPGLTILLGGRRWRRAAAVGSAGRGDCGWLSGAGWGATGPGPGARRAESGLERRRRVERVAASRSHTDGPDSLQRLAADRNLKARNRARRGRSERGAGWGGACGRLTSGNPLRAVPTLSNRSAPRAARYPTTTPAPAAYGAPGRRQTS